MSLRKLFRLPEALTDSIPTLDQGLGRLYRRKAGEGPQSDGVPKPLPPGGLNRFTHHPGEPVETDPEDRTIRTARPNLGGAGAPPKAGGPFSRPPNAPPEEPLPDLPLEASIKGLYGLKTVEGRGPGPRSLSQLYRFNEMARPVGAFSRPVMMMLKWAKEQGGREFTARDLFRVWRAAGGQPNQGDDRKAYASFQTSLRHFIDPRGRGTPETPIVVVQTGQRGRGGSAIYRWGMVAPSRTAAAKPTPGSTPFDDIELGPAGAPSGGHPAPPADMPDQEPPEDVDDEFEDEEAAFKAGLAGSEDEFQQALSEPEEEPEGEDEFDWIPEPSEDTQVGRSMLRLQEEDPEKLQDLFIAIQGSKTVLDAASKAIQMFGRGTVLGRHAIVVAKTAAANLGLPDPDDVL